MYSNPLIPIVPSVITPPVGLPVTVAYVKNHLRSLTTQDDTMIETWITAAASYIEEQTGRQLLTATREIWLDAFPLDYTNLAKIELPNPPLQSVSSVLYVAGDGTLTSFDDGASPAALLYDVKAPAGPYAPRGWIVPKYGQMWPIARTEAGAVRIQYVCGYGDAQADIPELIVGLICFLVGNFDQNRSSEAFRTGFGDLPMGIQMALDGFKYSAYPSTALRHGWPWSLEGFRWR